MSIEPDREDFFRYATYAVVGLTVVVCLCFGLIFVNPRANPFGNWRPAAPTEDLAAFAFPPTWTPVPTSTATATPTNTSTATATNTSTNTPLPTNTSTPTNTPTTVPSSTPKPTVPPTKTRPPAPPPPPPATWTPIPTINPYSWSWINMGCQHSGGVYIIVRAYLNQNDPNSNTNGVHTRVSWEPDGGSIGDVTTSNGQATYVLSPDGHPPKTGTFYAWIVDDQGSRISTMSPGIVINGKKETAPDSCWMAFVNFVKNP